MKKSNLTRTPLGKKPVLRMGRLETVPVYPNGKFVFTGQSSPVVNPATGKVFARMAGVERSHVAQAVEAVHATFVGWRRITAKSRGDVLQKNLRRGSLGLKKESDE